MALVPLRNKFGVLKGTQFEEDNFDLQKTVPGAGTVQMGRSKELHGKASDADWWPVYADPADLTP